MHRRMLEPMRDGWLFLVRSGRTLHQCRFDVLAAHCPALACCSRHEVGACDRRRQQIFFHVNFRNGNYINIRPALGRPSANNIVRVPVAARWSLGKSCIAKHLELPGEMYGVLHTILGMKHKIYTCRSQHSFLATFFLVCMLIIIYKTLTYTQGNGFERKK